MDSSIEKNPVNLPNLIDAKCVERLILCWSMISDHYYPYCLLKKKLKMKLKYKSFFTMQLFYSMFTQPTALKINLLVKNMIVF